MGWDRRARRRGAALLLVAALAGGLGVLAYAVHLLRRSEQQTIDTRFSIRGARGAPRDIVLVLIENNTFAELTRLHLQSEFPFPRRYDARVIDNLRRAGARTIALDLEFAHPTDETDDNDLFEALSRARGHTVLAATQIAPGGVTEVLGGPAGLLEAGARAGESVLVLDSDGVARRIGYSFSGLRSFPVVAAEVATGRHVSRSLFDHGALPIDFAGPPGTFTSISFAKVLEGRFPPGLFSGKTVVVGASAAVLQDVHTTATSGSSVMSGAELMGNSIDTLLRGAPLRNAPGWLNILVVMLLGVVVPLSGMRATRVRLMLGALALAALFAVGTQVAFNDGLILSFTYPLLALVLGTLGTLGVLYVLEAMERERVRDAFSRFVPSDVVDEVLARAGSELRLGGVERDCTVMFSDLRGFTSFSETQPAALVIDVVNHYLNEMTEAILAAGGTLVAFMGDGIMAVFGAPLAQDDHADRALAAAREMAGPRLDRFNAWMESEGFGHTFRMGVGLHSGSVMSGNVGSEQRMEYTAIGDTTNTASRLEGMTKTAGVMVLISETTHARLRDGGGEGLVPLGRVEIRGRNEGLLVWSIAAPDAATPAGEAMPAGEENAQEPA
ncbi:MAG TPA: adenylate/guanylate cyclase domain-containing protein, partial [Solirubrobacteraceae bacterium]|nr:adenylate/guanylate cyclase domain-containing protein [Solirubrobacteraceae bacterium]